MRAVAHDLPEQNPPHASHRNGGSWATVSRRRVRPAIVPIEDGFQPDDVYVRRYWVASIGAGAVEDLLRLVTAGRRTLEIPEPLFLSTLLTEGLAAVRGDLILVPDPIPGLGQWARARLTPGLRTEHAAFMLARSPASDRYGSQ